MLSKLLLRKYGIEHEVLNAKQHEREAQIVAKAGHQHENAHGEKVGNVTIATNMAGRGTDIKLSKECHAAGGLHVIGTERHTARRIDNQLRGRSGRQGDPGSSRFYVSLEDELKIIEDSGLLQQAWYLANNADVAEAGIDPLEHFCHRGWREERKPNQHFDPAWYLQAYGATVGHEANPLVDYITKGERAGRRPCPSWRPVFWPTGRPRCTACRASATSTR